MLLVKKIDPRATLPTVGHPGEDLAYDLYALDDTYLYMHQANKVRTGIAARYVVPYKEHEKYGLLIRDRSLMASSDMFIVGGVVDAGYTGEIIVLMQHTRGDLPLTIKAGQKIAQIIPLRVLTDTVFEVDTLTDTSRGEKGFGSTGF